MHETSKSFTSSITVTGMTVRCSSNVEGKYEWFWNGTSNENSRLTMIGRLYRNISGYWFYEEALFRDGNQNVFFNRSPCKVASGEDINSGMLEE
jgi:hypothetical protein